MIEAVIHAAALLYAENADVRSTTGAKDEANKVCARACLRAAEIFIREADRTLDDLEKLRAEHATFQREMAERTEWANELKAKLGEKDAQIVELQQKLTELEAQKPETTIVNTVTVTATDPETKPETADLVPPPSA